VVVEAIQHFSGRAERQVRGEENSADPQAGPQSGDRRRRGREPVEERDIELTRGKRGEDVVTVAVVNRDSVCKTNRRNLFAR